MQRWIIIRFQSHIEFIFAVIQTDTERWLIDSDSSSFLVWIDRDLTETGMIEQAIIDFYSSFSSDLIGLVQLAGIILLDVGTGGVGLLRAVLSNAESRIGIYSLIKTYQLLEFKSWTWVYLTDGVDSSGELFCIALNSAANDCWPWLWICIWLD